MSAPQAVTGRGFDIHNACDCGAVRWRVETFLDAAPVQTPGNIWTQLEDSGVRRWTCLACGAEYLVGLRMVTRRDGAQ